MNAMKATHTPGPWQYYADLPSTDPNWHVVTNASRQRVVANVHIEPGNAQDVANARLIAAAPDLLEAREMLRDVRQFMENGGVWSDVAEAVDNILAKTREVADALRATA